MLFYGICHSSEIETISKARFSSYGARWRNWSSTKQFSNSHERSILKHLIAQVSIPTQIVER